MLSKEHFKRNKFIKNRQQALYEWFAEQTNIVDSTLEVVSADASFRRYFRVTTAHSSFILVDAPPQTEKNKEFIEFATQYAAVGLDVPRVMFSDIEQGFLCLSDLGGQLLLPLIERQPQYWYQKSLRLLPIMANVHVSDNSARYDRHFFEVELGLFEQWFCQDLLQLSPSVLIQYDLASCFEFLINNALEQPQITTHRDFHGRNIMVRDNQSLAIIDFQDTVIGPLTYDVVSLLKDCYYQLDSEVRQILINSSFELYRNQMSLTINSETYQRWFDLMGLQRHLKVCGIFSRLHLRDGKAAYLNDLPLVVEYITEICVQYEELTPLKQLFEECILPILSQRITQCMQ